MKRTAARTMTTIDAAELIRNQIEEKVEKIQEKRASVRSRLARGIRFLFNAETENPYNLTPAMNARLYL